MFKREALGILKGNSQVPKEVILKCFRCIRSFKSMQELLTILSWPPRDQTHSC